MRNVDGIFVYLSQFGNEPSSKARESQGFERLHSIFGMPMRSWRACLVSEVQLSLAVPFCLNGST